MNRLSRMAEKLLSEIIEHRLENGNCDTQYWKSRFDVLSMSEDIMLRSLFKELRVNDMISVQWADDYPYQLFLLPRGIEYFESKEEQAHNDKIVSYTNNFYGSVTDIQIQQGTYNSSQNVISNTIDDNKLNELINLIRRYDTILDQEFGEQASKLRECCKDLDEANKKNQPSSIKRRILDVIKDISSNAIGGVISGAILNLIMHI